jgi:hypothetical protein
MIEGHTSRSFDGSLAALHLRVLEMGGLVPEQVREAGRAFTEWDEAAAERVMERERIVNYYDMTVDNGDPTYRVDSKVSPIAGMPLTSSLFRFAFPGRRAIRRAADELHACVDNGL